MNSTVTDEASDEDLAVFFEKGSKYAAENMIRVVATVSRSNQPRVVPVAYRFDGTGTFFGGWNLQRSLKFNNRVANKKVAVVLDEIVSTRPWRVSEVEARGEAHPNESQGNAAMVRIKPRTVRSEELEE